MSVASQHVHWSQAMCLCLMDYYADAPELWDTSHALYRDFAAKKQRWAAIGQAFGASGEAVQRKMGSLLASFRREKTKYLQTFQTPKWYGFQRMSFLLDKGDSNGGPFNMMEGGTFPADDYSVAIEADDDDGNDDDEEEGGEGEATTDNGQPLHRSLPPPPPLPSTITTSSQLPPLHHTLHHPPLFAASSSLSSSSLSSPALKRKRSLPPQPPSSSASPHPPFHFADEDLSTNHLRDLEDRKPSDPSMFFNHNHNHASPYHPHGMPPGRAQSPPARDDCSTYGEHVANKLRHYDKTTRSLAEYQINQVLFQADMGLLTREGLEVKVLTPSIAPSPTPAVTPTVTPASTNDQPENIE